MNCQKCHSDKVIYSWPWTDKTPMMPMCGQCVPDFQTYYNLMFNVINSTLVGLGQDKMSLETFQECFPIENKVGCICEDSPGATLCSSNECKNRKGKK